MSGSRRASMVFPDPGGSSRSKLCAPAAAISKARLANSCPCTSARSAVVGLVSLRRRAESTVVGISTGPPVRCWTTVPRSALPRTSNSPTPAASRAFSSGSTNAPTPLSLHPEAMSNAPRTGLRRPLNPSSPTKQRPSTRSCGTTPMPMRRARAMGRSKALPSFGTSAGARFTVMRRGGRECPMFWRAAVTRSRPSRTAPCGSPTTTKAGSPTERLTSTDTE